MADLIQTIKEANAELSTLLSTLIGHEDLVRKTEELLKDEEKLKKYFEDAGKLTIKYHERVKEQVSLEYFAELMILDRQFNFMGGGVLKEGENTVIEIK